MRKTLIVLALIMAVLATGCKKNDKSKSLNYSDANPITIALRDYHQISVTSDYDLSFSSSNNLYVTVSGDGVIYGKNVGNADITISNGYESKNVPVKVDLFIEPTFEFGCSPSHINSLYGSPYAIQSNDSILRYIYTAYNGYSYACGQMDFLFLNQQYIESQVYIREGVEYLLDNYINENFNAIDTTLIYNTFVEDSVVCYVYRNKIDQTIILGKYDSGDQWNETFLFYFQSTPSEMLRQRIKKHVPIL